MKYTDYQVQRKALLDEANALIEQGQIGEANAKMDEAKSLDEKWDAICTAQANARALEGAARKQDVSNPGAAPGAGAIDSTEGIQSAVKPEDLYKTVAYRTAWAKKMMGSALTQEEAETFRMVNAYTHTTENTGVVIPETVASGIWSEVEELYPYFSDITKTYVNGILTLIQSDTASDAAWYDEDTATEDGEELFKSYQLTGCELSRAITVSWKLKEMAIDDFIPYIQRRMAERMGKALGYGVTNGKGKPGTGDTFKPEPLGVVTALLADKRQVVTYTQGAMGYSDLTAARALIKSGYANGLAIYANATTIWTGLANVKDDNGRPIFVGDPTAGGVYKVLGLTVKEDSSMADGDVLLSNASAGYQANINKQIGVVTEDHGKARTTDYCGYAIVDGAPLTLYAHALLTPAANGEDAGSGE